jgi:hypothetical protein
MALSISDSSLMLLFLIHSFTFCITITGIQIIEYLPQRLGSPRDTSVTPVRIIHDECQCFEIPLIWRSASEKSKDQG